MALLNIGLNNTGHLTQQQAKNIAYHMIGGGNIRQYAEHRAASDESTFVVDTFCDITPEMVYRVAVALNQDCIAYYNTAEEFGLLIGPKAAAWGPFDPTLFLLHSGEPLEEDAKPLEEDDIPHPDDGRVEFPAGEFPPL